MSENEQQTGRNAGRRAAFRAATAIVFFGAIALAIMIFGADEAYLWIKALHIIAVISWMAGLLYMPRLFIYHGDSEPGSAQAETFAIMEQRLFKVIMNPAMMVAWILGLYLAWSVYGFHGGWLHAKLAAVVALTGVHLFFSRAVASFGRGHYVRNARFWRLMNEVPTLLMIVIVILVVVKPF
ncbi:TIGR00701 family protein [Rhizobium sp. ACO-34A]|nr:protoporphyrinogen oxidase HemJ [Rhizobium sp. ACO-34A]ATN36555.1 TIGR00701 family protein [Rhizobium sp. ACO-34A]